MQEENAGLLAQMIVPSAQDVVRMAAAASLDHVVPVQDQTGTQAQDEKLRWRWDNVLKYQQQQKSTFQSTSQLSDLKLLLKSAITYS